MTSKEIRKKFIKFFESKGHKHLPSSSLIPEDDPSVLLTTAGMQQFKKWFTGEVKPKYPRVVTIQKCVRTSDIEEVGDETHLTFFEMLGNFSFGYPELKDSYFKKETIQWGLELIKSLGVSDERIHFSVFSGDKELKEDIESYQALKELGVLDNKIKKLGRQDNFWGPTGDEGPCGPTVEIYVDDVEIWNLVFNEYYQDKSGKFTSLKSKGVDTGMGLERLVAVLNKFDNVYDTNELREIIHTISPFLGELKEEEQVEEYPIVKRTRDERIIADHLRAATFLLADGVKPSNLAQGYVLRRLIRRAIRYGKMIGIDKNFCSRIAKKVIEEFGDLYPELKKNEKKIYKELEKEEERFKESIKKGLKASQKILGDKKPINKERYLGIMEKVGKKEFFREIFRGDYKKISELSPDINKKEFLKAVITGKEAFDLYQTYGFPLEMIIEIAQERRLFIDIESFRRELRKHQELSQKGAKRKFKGGLVAATKETAKLHTATHLLQQALRKVLGNHIKQAGSNITPERLRFDFTHPEKMTEEQIKKVEDLVNQKIEEGLKVESKEMSYNEAIRSGALAVYSKESYPEKVKVYSIGVFSKEICGGPHIKNTSGLGQFKIIKEEASSAGIRRIKAILTH